MNINQITLTLAFLVLSFLTYGQKEFVPPANNNGQIDNYSAALEDHVDNIVDNLGKEYKSDLRKFYKAKLKASVLLAENEHFFFHQDWNGYLDEITDKIMSNNPEHNFEGIQVVLSQYFWPNAFSIGEGTIVINPGLITRLENEDQLAFILCHEFAHYLLDHSEKAYLRLLREMESEELQDQIDQINKSEYYKATQLRKLLKSRLYSTNKHAREKEVEADSLGLELFKNTGYDFKAAMTTMQILDKLGEKADRHLDIPTLIGIDPVQMESSNMLSGNSQEGGWLDFDSVKSHPDCDARFDLLAKKLKVENAVFSEFKADGEASDDFKKFRRQMQYFTIESYKRFNRLDVALLSVWQMKKEGDENVYLDKEEFHLIARLLYARKKHKIGHVCTYPNDSMESSLRQLNSVLFGLRYRDLSKKLIAMATELYDIGYEDEESVYCRVLLAYCKGDKEDFETSKKEYFARFDRSDEHYEDVFYLRL